MRRLVLVRHGESVWNAEGRIQGQQCAGLSATGHAQAAATASALCQSYPDADLITSDLQRTVETTLPLAKSLERDARKDPDLRERSFGQWEGRLRSEVTHGDHERWARWMAGDDVVAEIGGESVAQLCARVEPLLRRLLSDTPLGGVTIAVTHGGPIWHGTHRLLNLAPPTFAGVSNASVTELLAADDGRLVLDRWNEVAHLPPDVRMPWQPRATSDAPPVGR